MQSAIDAQATEQKVKIKQFVGTVEIRAASASAWRPARIGMPLRTGWDVRTFVESNAELEYESGTLIKLGENSVVTLAALAVDGAATKTSLKVPSGQVWGNIKKLANTKSSFDFETPTAVASIRGTRLGLNVRKGRTSIDVYEGEVSVRNRGSGKEAKVNDRERAVVNEGSGNVEVTDFETLKKKSPGGGKELEDPYAGDTTKAPQDTSQRTDTLGAKAGDIPLQITTPQEGAVVAQTPIYISGKTLAGAAVKIMDKQLAAGSDGAFGDYFELKPGANAFTITASGGTRSGSVSLTVQYRPPLFLSVTNIIDNMEVVSSELQVDVEVTEGAFYSVNGVTGATKVTLNPGKNQIMVAAWDPWNNRTEKAFLVNYKPVMAFVLELVSPRDNSTVTAPMIPVVGSTSPGAGVTVNGTTVSVNASGFFSMQMPIPDEARDYSIDVVARLGTDEKTESRTVTYVPAPKPLSLVISTPAEDQVIRQSTIHITGKTSEGANVKINGRPAVVSAKGVISMDMQVNEKDIGTYTLEIIASREEQEISKNIPVKIDITSPQINISQPRLQVTGLGKQATRTPQLSVQAFDQTPGDVITVTVTNNGTTENLSLDPGGRDEIMLNEGKNVLAIKARDLAGNAAQPVTATIYFLPGPIEISVIDPPDNPITIDDLPPWPQGAGGMSKIRFRIEIRDNIGTVPETIRYCRITSSLGQTVVLANERNYFYYGDMPVGRGSTVFTIQVEDLAGTIQQKRIEARIGN